MKHMKGVDPITPEAPARKRHFLFDHPIIAGLVVIVLWLGIATGVLYGAIMAGIDVKGMDSRLANGVASIISSLLVALLYQLWFRNEFDGMFEWSSFGLLLAFPAVAFCFSNLFDFDTMKFVFQNPDAKMNSIPLCLALSLAPGISEELIFRGVPVSNWMRTVEDDSAIMKCALFTSIVFGIVHGANIFAGAAITSTIYQVVYSVCIGFFFAAVFIRTASIWPTIIVHALVDLTAFMFMDMKVAGIMTEELTIGTAFFVTVGINVVLVLLGLLFLRKSKHEEIMQLWNRKWRKTGIVEQNRFRY